MGRGKRIAIAGAVDLVREILDIASFGSFFDIRLGIRSVLWRKLFRQNSFFQIMFGIEQHGQAQSLTQ